MSTTILTYLATAGTSDSAFNVDIVTVCLVNVCIVFVIIIIIFFIIINNNWLVFAVATVATRR